MEKLLNNFFEEINPLIRQLRIKENIKQDDISYKLEVLSIKREIREKTQSFIEDYKTKCMNEIERLKNEIVNCEDSKNKNILEKELSNSEKELEAFNELMGDIDFSNSNYIFFLQALIGRMEEQTMSRMNDGIIYVNGKKVKDMNTFTVEDALKIGKEEKFDIVRSPDFPTPEEEKKQCEKLNSIFEKLEEDFKGCLSPEYYYLKQKIYDTPGGRKDLFQEPLTLETMYKVIIRNLKEGSPERKNNENMLNAVIARKEEIEQSKNKQHKESTKQSSDCLAIEVKKKQSIFDNIKKAGKNMKSWFVTKFSGNNRNKISEENTSKKDEQIAYFETLKADVDATIIHYTEIEKKKAEEREVI